jgi:hypothetical protein
MRKADRTSRHNSPETYPTHRQNRLRESGELIFHC